MADVANNNASPKRRDGIGDMEVTVNTKQIRKLALVGAAAALSLQLVAGTASAAVPNASANSTFSNYAGNGNAGFSTTLTYQDSSTLAKAYLEADITGGSGVVALTATKNGMPVANACSVQSAPLAVLCTFKTVRNTDVLTVTWGVRPSGDTVTAQPLWSSTGFVTGGNNSHGDSWIDPDFAPSGIMTATKDPSPDKSFGFGNSSLSTSSDFGNNSQFAALQNLPAGQFSSLNDAGDGGTYPLIVISVNGGQPYTFQLLVTYPKGTGTPKTYEHYNEAGVLTDVYNSCQGKVRVNCFTWSSKTNTATLYLLHNGGVRRT